MRELKASGNKAVFLVFPNSLKADSLANLKSALFNRDGQARVGAANRHSQI